MCCKCCELGVQAGRHHEDCEPVTVLEEKCGEQFTNCCKKAKSCKIFDGSPEILMGTFSFSLVDCDGGFEMGDDGRCRGMFCVDKRNVERTMYFFLFR